MKAKVVILTLAACLPATSQDRRITPIAVQRKQALIIGNSAYARAPLKNPGNDAAAMEGTLRKLGFEVKTLRDLDLPHMEAAIDEFTSSLASGSLGFFYFSGHGVQVNSINYLLPTDFAASSEADVKYKAYPATRVQEKMEESGARLRVLVLDACRNNPFHFKRDAAGGLAAMSVNAEGTLVAFATGDNNTADDNQSGSNGLYTKYLVSALLTPGLQLREAFQKAKEEVYTASRRAQNPSIYENVVGAYYLVSAPSGAGGKLDAAAETWALIKDSTNPDDFADFAKAYPQSDLARGAEIRAAQLRRAVVVSTEAAAGTKKVNSKDGLKYVWIPPGKFMMGCSPGDSECDDDEKPAREATISRGFWLGQTPVTQQAYEKVMGKNPSYSKGANRPVEQVTWHESQAYCQAIGGRLPTEAEWEYAARAGSTQSRYGDIDRIAWYRGNSDGKTHDVAQKDPNAWGLYDMLGNVWQWSADWYETGKTRSLRGGSWLYDPRSVRVSGRFRYVPGYRVLNYGLRCVGE